MYFPELDKVSLPYYLMLATKLFRSNIPQLVLHPMQRYMSESLSK